MSFDLLSEPIRKFIRDKGWEQLRPIQTAAIAKILASDDNFILASRTASGKTEAAFLPILSKVNFNDSGANVQRFKKGSLDQKELDSGLEIQGFNTYEELRKVLDELIE